MLYLVQNIKSSRDKMKVLMTNMILYFKIK